MESGKKGPRKLQQRIMSVINRVVENRFLRILLDITLRISSFKHMLRKHRTDFFFFFFPLIWAKPSTHLCDEFPGVTLLLVIFRHDSAPSMLFAPVLIMGGRLTICQPLG